MVKPKTMLELFSVDGRLTKSACARDAAGNKVATWNPAACSFCVYGAALLVHGSRSEEVMKKLGRLIPDRPVVVWADDPKTTIEDVRRLCAKAGV